MRDTAPRSPAGTCFTCLAGLLALAVVVTAGAATAQPDETHHYSVTYRGVFSMGQDMPIADAVLTTRTPVGRDGAPAALTETRLDASSAAHPLVESLYPIRYRFRSWARTDGGAVLAFETYEKTGKERHRLYLRDQDAAPALGYVAAQAPHDDTLAALETGAAVTPSSAPADLFDRLGLLQRVRRQSLDEGARFDFTVTNGRERFAYRVLVEAAQTVQVHGVAVPAWKLRFDGAQLAPDGRREAAHRPVYIWLSQAGDRVPLRADSRHAIGLFRLELDDRVALTGLAGVVP